MHRALDALALAVLIAGWAYLLLPGRSAPAVALPSMGVRADGAGVRCAIVDTEALRQAFIAAGLPDPPDLNGSDPVPVGKVLSFARDWMETGSISALGGLAQVYQALDEDQASLECFAAAAQLDPGEVRWSYGQGAQCQAMGLQEEAMRSLERAVEIDPGYPTAWARLGALYLERGELDAAAQRYDQCRRLLPGQSIGYVGLGRVALARGEAVRAQEYFSAAVASTPNDFMAHRLLGLSYAVNGKPDLARREQALAERLPHYSGWLTFDPRLQEAHELADTQQYLADRMSMAAGAGDFRTMALIGERLLYRRPNDYSALGNLAVAYLELGRGNDADAAVTRALALKPDSARLHLTQATIAFSREDLAAAHESLDAAKRLDPSDPRVFELRGRTCLLEGRSAEGIEALNRALALDPDAVDARLVLAVAYRSAGRDDEALRTLERLLELDPDNGQARRMLQALRSAAAGSRP
jgi:tetratricopeptide (TPR) repeat protein